MTASFSHAKLYVKHRAKLALVDAIRFVISRPRLLSAGMRIVNRVPALKWRLWRVHASMRSSQADPTVRLPDTPPPAAQSVYLQLIEPGMKV